MFVFMCVLLCVHIYNVNMHVHTHTHLYVYFYKCAHARRGQRTSGGILRNITKAYDRNILCGRVSLWPGAHLLG